VVAGNPATANSGNCYPPAVNYTPLYYLFNGVAFNKTAAATANPSLFATSPVTGVTTGTTGTVWVRLVNAGLRMHVPSIVGAQIGAAVAPATVPPSGFSLIAEDGNLLPGVPRVQSEVFMAAGKTYDVMINVPAAGGTALPVFDRQLSLSSNATARDFRHVGLYRRQWRRSTGRPCIRDCGSPSGIPTTPGLRATHSLCRIQAKVWSPMTRTSTA